MYAIRKSDLKTFQCNSKSVCRIEDGSTNTYLMHDRAIENFLFSVEPKYNSALAKLREARIDRECIHAIAGFVAYIACCAPAAMRIHVGPQEATLEATAIILDRQGLITKAPPELGSKSITELLAEKEIQFDVDPKYLQAIGINSIESRLSVFGNSRWEILLNKTPDCPFFTSDFPVALEARSERLMNWIVPLAPDLAVRIIPDIHLSRTAPDFSFSKFTSRHRQLRRSEVVELNRLIVRCAEDLIFYRDSHSWIETFVTKNRNYRIDAVTECIPLPDGVMNISTQRIVSYKYSLK